MYFFVVLLYEGIVNVKKHAEGNPLRAFALRTNWEVFGKLTVSKTISRKKKKP